MKTIYIFFFTIFIFSICNAQTETTINLSFNKKDISLPGVIISGIRYTSGLSIEDQFSIDRFFNPSNSKLELKFEKYLVKFTGSNTFVTITNKETTDTKVIQIPLKAIRFKNDIYIPIDYCKAILELALQCKLDIKNPLALSSGNKQPAPENNKINIPEITPTGKPKPEQIQKVSGTDNPIGNYDIYGIGIEEKANGTLVKFKCNKKLTSYSTNIDKGILLLNIVGATAGNDIAKDFQPKGLVKKIKYKKFGSNLQFEIYLNEGYSTSEAFQDPGSNEFLITIHNKLLSNNSSYNKQKERWVFDTIVIDAGHGGKDPGAIGVSGVKEKDINLAIALKLGQYIKEEMKDIKIVYTRSTDKFIELYKRGKIANENNGKLFISLHCNSMPKKPSNRNGFEIYLLRPGRTAEAIAIAESENSVISYEDNPERYQALTDENFILVSMAHSSYMKYSEQFSDILNKQFSNDLSVTSNGVKQAGFYVLVGASMPSVLIETGFISNKKDEAYLNNKSGQNDIAHSIFNSIKNFKEQYDHNLKAEL
jgi:N-acetylmuramoyl-L-alanine amidase